MPLKQPQAHGDQLATLQALADAKATTEANACKPPMLAGANLLNRLYARGWLAKADGGRCWITEAGEQARAYAAAYAAQQQEAA